MDESSLSQVGNVCSEIVPRGLCIGCGVCSGLCPVDNLCMEWTVEGMMQPVDQGKCLPECHRCLHVCPFADQTEDEDVIANACFGDIPGIQRTSEVGWHLKSYVGFAGGSYREHGASGGMASWFLASLLESGEVDRVVCVSPQSDPEQLFSYQIAADAEKVRASAKSAYYPVELSKVIRTIRLEPGRYAVIGLPCALKGLRLAMKADKRLQDRVAVVIGLVCGQTKSRAFTEHLIRSQGLDPLHVSSFSFRNKDLRKSASDYFAEISTPMESAVLPWNSLYGRTWLNGEFTPKSCLFCDDIFSEVADAVFMDAWLPEFIRDAKGTSIVLTRSPNALHVIEYGAELGHVVLSPLSLDKVSASQWGVVEQKRKQLAHRLWLAAESGVCIRKRVAPVRPSLLARQVLLARENLRQVSHKAFREAVNSASDPLQTYNLLTRTARFRLKGILVLERYYKRAKAVASKLLRFIRRETSL